MISVLIQVESRFLVDRKKLRMRVSEFLSKRVHRKAEVSISIVGNRKMRLLNKTYRQLDKPTNVLSFSLTEKTQIEKETKFVPEQFSPDQVLRLGDVVVSYPIAVQEAAAQNKMVDDRIYELVEHGILHLLGIHHD